MEEPCVFRREEWAGGWPAGDAVSCGPDSRSWSPAQNADKLRANVAMLKSLGVETELVDRNQLRKIEPAARVDDVGLAAYEPRSGYADPVATTEAFAAAAQKLGAVFSLNTPVAALAMNAGRAVGVTDASGKTHDADFVCLVTGPWTDILLAPFGLKIGIKPERAQIAFFRKPAPAASQHLHRHDRGQLFSSGWRRPDDGGTGSA